MAYNLKIEGNFISITDLVTGGESFRTSVENAGFIVDENDVFTFEKNFEQSLPSYNFDDLVDDRTGAAFVSVDALKTFLSTRIGLGNSAENVLYWELNFNGTDDVIFVPCTTTNMGTFSSGSGTDVGTVTISTDGITYGSISYSFTVTNGTTYYFKRSTATVTGVFKLAGEYA